MARRVCAEPGCPALTDSTRCTDHTRAREKARGTRQRRGYGTDHDRLRATYQRRMDMGEVIYCWRCPRQIDPCNWDLGHDDADRTKYRGPECIACNRATASRSSNRG